VHGVRINPLIHFGFVQPPWHSIGMKLQLHNLHAL